MEKKPPMDDDAIRGRLGAPVSCFLVIFREGSCYLPGPGDPGETPLSAHVRYQFALMQEGAVSFCGPVTDNTDVKWVAVFPTADKTRVTSFADEDPDVRSGRLKYEIHPVAGINLP